MEIKNCIEFSSTKGERVYSFHVPAGSPFGEIYDVAFEILSQAVKYAQEAAAQAAPKEIPTDTNKD